MPNLKLRKHPILQWLVILCVLASAFFCAFSMTDPLLKEPKEIRHDPAKRLDGVTRQSSSPLLLLKKEPAALFFPVVMLLLRQILTKTRYLFLSTIPIRLKKLFLDINKYRCHYIRPFRLACS
ncbi:hypothetical protein MJA45_02995 [Paenibacillus aurantius]|uniref:Uncharacterized protein n=1 Tax=Paenibacillus aurantius TaxID=2918900 RepID=A0AA96RIC4_9BACL|nr:hypothetical protein [Paenibacillus aurantius]WJH36697.1 hypothetical protein N6H14_13760 [Paenibacillus sp. CC-CFT747]WNQ12044.1 hypothetical protein MJA45_02995 [Paenibacillus aurantius]